jgi:hypothetical protein
VIGLGRAVHVQAWHPQREAKKDAIPGVLDDPSNGLAELRGAHPPRLVSHSWLTD